MTRSHAEEMNNSSSNLLSSAEVMKTLGYKDRGSFWQLVYREGIPHVRLNARVIKFPEAGLHDWIRRRSSDAA